VSTKYCCLQVFYKWAMLALKERPPPCKGGKGRFWPLQTVTEPAYLCHFLFYAMLAVSGCCAPGDVGVMY
jgi:hypothetical protein